MKLFEFYQPAPPGWQSVEDDKSSPRWGETRKTKLTLSMINKIRTMNEVQAYERAQDLKKIRKQYGTPEGGDQAAGGLPPI
jgi:hypothetical protein